ncbi:MAG: methyltransferase domain-containing protein [Coriobacteriia bacterium]|nr:methyltransferase domain-containing protein [Coriobacteriia bacterium]
MTPWNPDEYLRFGDERTRPSVDLASRIAVESPSLVIDLGCGPGNSTRVLRDRWPEAHVIGLDSSAEMIDAARAEMPQEEWIHSGIEEWNPPQAFDVVFSNAALQWLPDHSALVQRLFAAVAPGGALGFQIPSASFAAVRTLIHAIALDGPWTPRMTGPLGALTMESPGVYYDCLSPEARSVDIWETEYFHVMDSHAAIVDWIGSTGLRPFLDALGSETEKQQFVSRLDRAVRQTYPLQQDGRVLFPFRRTFVIAYR